jgi:hypothetical protein
MTYGNRTPLLMSALAVLEREAEDNPDAAHLWMIIEALPPFCQWWAMLGVLNHFDGSVRCRPALNGVLLKELSAAFPVPLALLH